MSHPLIKILLHPAHPALSDPSKVVLKYTAYKGWIYSGISRWSLDRLILTNAFGVRLVLRNIKGMNQKSLLIFLRLFAATLSALEAFYYPVGFP